MSEKTRLTPKRRKGLEVRASVLRTIRDFFEKRAFLEIEAPLCVPAPGLEVHLKALRVGERYLITSPEYQLKRLLAGGLTKIYSMCRCFRAEEEGKHHATEFTMLEWYRADDVLESVMDDTEALVSQVALAHRGQPSFEVKGRAIDVSSPWIRLSVRQAMQKHAGVDVEGDEDTETLQAKVVAAGYDIGSATEWDDLFYIPFVQSVDPALAGYSKGVHLTDWPIRLGALAKANQKNPKVVERFESYVGGIELANAFGELTDATEQKKRLLKDLAYRKRRGFHEPPLDLKFLAALEEGMPESAGIALGVDRLAMLAAGAEHIRVVQAFGQGEL